MFSFYGDISCTLPCVICDPGMRVLFANRTAYTEPLTVKWIDRGKAELDGKLIADLEESFKNDPFAIAKLDMHRNCKHYTLLADRQSLCGATVYVFALVRNSEEEKSSLPTELDGRRMLTACFSPLYGNAEALLNAQTVQTWTDIASKAVQKNGKTLKTVSNVSTVGCAVQKRNALLCCATAIIAAYCKGAKDDINVCLKEDRLGTTIAFSAEMASDLEASLSACTQASLISSCFTSAQVPMLVAMQTAESCGFSIHADTNGKNVLSVTLRAAAFDPGDAGFKAPADLIGNTVTSIYAVTELLI